MVELHPQILRKHGREEFVILPYEEFAALQEMLEDAEDVLALRQAKQDEPDSRTIGLDELKRQLDEPNTR